MKSYKRLNAIYIGGWYKSHSVGNAEAHGHLLAFPSKGIVEDPASLLNHIHELFSRSGAYSLGGFVAGNDPFRLYPHNFGNTLFYTIKIKTPGFSWLMDYVL